MGGTRKAHRSRILVGKPERKMLLGRRRHGWGDVECVFCIVGTKQLLLPAYQQERHDSSPYATGNWAETVQTPVQLCAHSRYVLVVVCVDMVWYTAGQRVFLYESYVNSGSARKCRRKFCRRFPGNTVPSTWGTIKFLRKLGPLAHFWTRNPLENAVCLPKKIRNRGWIRTQAREITDTPSARDRHLEIV
jgi:hypothetical protein